jgi:hypothetical protein
MPDKYDYKLPEKCNYTLTDEEALCYIKNNKLGPDTGNNLNQARIHWKTHGCFNELNYECPDCPSDPNKTILLQQNNKNIISNHSIQQTGTITDFTFVIQDVIKENNFLTKQITESDNNNLAMNSVSNYNQEQYENLKFYNEIFFWKYYVVWFILLFFLFFLNSNLDLSFRIILSIVFFLFPFVINYIIHCIKYTYHYLVAILYKYIFNGNVHHELNQAPAKIIGSPIIITPAPTTLPTCVIPKTN